MRKFILPLLLLAVALAAFLVFRNINRMHFVVEGQILGFSETNDRVYINHEAIPGYMEAMSMPFNILDPSVAAGFSAGDAIRFNFYVTPDGSWIDGLERIPDSLLTLAAAPARFSKLLGEAAAMPLKEGEVVPDFNLVTQAGAAFTRADLSGKINVVTFIYTACPIPDFCPLMSRNMDAVSRALNDGERGKTQLITISFDPERDTPEMLTTYASEHEQAPNRIYLTGEPEEIAKLTSAFGIFARPAGEEIIHNLQTAIVDGDGAILALYPGNKWTTEELITDLRRRLQ